MSTQPQDIKPEGTEFPSQGIVIDKAGMPVDANGWLWRLNALKSGRTLDFLKCLPLLPPVLEAVRSRPAASAVTRA
jgi:hypothetical protein